MLGVSDPTYEFQRDLRANQNLYLIYKQQSHEASEHLCSGSHVGVHEARKRLKKLRALVKMVGGPREKDQLFRSVAHSVGAVRDAQSLVECAERLRGEMPQAVSELLEERLKKRRDSIARDDESVTKQYAESIEKEADEISFWLPGDDLSDGAFFEQHVAEGAARIYGKAKKTWSELVSRGWGEKSDQELKWDKKKEESPFFSYQEVWQWERGEGMHELRKLCKQVWYVWCMLVNVMIPMSNATRQCWKRMGDMLGHHHDAFCLLQWMVTTDQAVAWLPETWAREWVAMATVKSMRMLEVKSLHYAKLLFTMTQKQFKEYLMTAYEIWKEEEDEQKQIVKK